MKPRQGDSELKFFKSKNQALYSGKQGGTATENPRADALHKYHSSFNSNPDANHLHDHKRPPQAPTTALDIECQYGDMYPGNDVSIEHRRADFGKPPMTKSSQSFKANERSGQIDVAQSQPDLRSHECPPSPGDVLCQGPQMPSSESRGDPKRKPPGPPPSASLNSSHIDDFMRNHPMKQNFQENFEKTFKVLDRTGATYYNTFAKQKISLYRNIETKMYKHDPQSAKALLSAQVGPPGTSQGQGQGQPSSQTLTHTQTGPCPSTAQATKMDKFSRPSTRQKINQSTSQNKNPAGQFNALYRPDEPVARKKPERKMSGLDEARKKPKGEFEFNHVFKILDFLDRDKTLKQGRKRIQDKMKDLGRESFNETNRKNAQMEQLNEESFRSEFVVKGTLGKGSYGEVKLCVSQKSGEAFAVKIYPRKYLKDEIKRQNLRNEREILQEMSHDNIIRLYRVVEGPRHIYLLTEYGGRASLHESLTNSAQNALSEEEAKPLIWQLAQALRYLHDEGVVHRDIKLHNVLVNDEGRLKLIDFGFALRLQPKELIKVFCGTPSYMSPEIVARTPYDGAPADMWAFAVCVYRMVVGTFPFRGELTSFDRRRALQAHPLVSDQVPGGDLQGLC